MTEDEHGEHAYVRAVDVPDDTRTALFAFYCGHHDEYGPVRYDYGDAVKDLMRHVYGDGQ